MPQPPATIDALDTFAEPYRAILCDVWGVVHNGVSAFPAAVEALRRVRRKGKAVVLVTNAPRLRGAVEEQLLLLGVSEDSRDRVVTSGDVTRALVREAPRKLLHIGPERDLGFFDGLDVELVEEFEAAGVVCTGLHDDETEKPEDYAELLRRLRSRDLPFICANPDIVVERGDRLVFCAGALAREYGLLGGRTLIAGKPHRPIYEAALAAAGSALGTPVSPEETLAIGDGMLTDVKGAAGMGIDVLYVAGGIHATEYRANDTLDPVRLSSFFERHGLWPAAMIEHLR